MGSHSADKLGTAIQNCMSTETARPVFSNCMKMEDLSADPFFG